MAIVIKNFKGMVPAISPKLLPDNFAQTANSCDLRTGKLNPLKAGLVTKTWVTGALHSLFKDETADRWLYWTDTDIKVIKGQVADGNNRLFYTGDGYPKQTDDTLFPGTGSPANTGHYRRLGITPPSVTLTINGPYGTADGEVKYSVSYYYTYVVKWADGTEEESKPVAATAVVDAEGGEYFGVSGFVKPTLAASGNDVTHFRVYRLNSGETGAEYQLAKMRPANTGAAAVYDLPVGDVPLNTTIVYDCNAASPIDDLNSDLGEVCSVEDWAPPPDDLFQIGQYTNGVLGGLSGKQFCVSEPFIHYAWLTGNRVTLSYTPVAWGTYRGMAIIATTAFPSIVTGADSSTLMEEPLKHNQSCLSARGFVITDIGAMYPSPDGLTLVDETGAKVLTRTILTKEQWDDLPPAGKTHADLVSFYYDNIYIGTWQGTGKGFVFNFKDDPYITTFDIATTIYHGTMDPIDDALYLLLFSSTGGNQNFAYKWEGGATYIANTFKSKIYSAPPTNYGFAKVIGNQSAGTPVTFKLYGDGSQIQHGGGDWSKSVQDTDIFRLPAGQKYETYEVQVESQAGIDFIIVGASGEEIARIVETL